MTTKFNESMSMIIAMLKDVAEENAELLLANPELQHHLDIMHKHGVNARLNELKINAPKAAEQAPGLTVNQLTMPERYLLAQLKRSGGNLAEAMLGNDIQRLLDHGFVLREGSEIQITQQGLDMVKPASRSSKTLTPANVLVR
ncbi:hypothetical protein [Pseudomonas sp. CFBP 13719]|nr:hypothetical protein [Pseudomonas sp. CFBP 13719]MBD8681415.1 hypothetical protein [Pseudomonas sp. CFBP 13719]